MKSMVCEALKKRDLSINDRGPTWQPRKMVTWRSPMKKNDEKCSCTLDEHAWLKRSCDSGVFSRKFFEHPWAISAENARFSQLIFCWPSRTDLWKAGRNPMALEPPTLWWSKFSLAEVCGSKGQKCSSKASSNFPCGMSKSENSLGPRSSLCASSQDMVHEVPPTHVK